MLTDDPGPSPMHGADPDDHDAARRYLEEVRRDIDDEVRRRRASGDLPPDVERELDQLFLAHSPLGGTGRRSATCSGSSTPRSSSTPSCPSSPAVRAGRRSRRGLRSLSLWYLRYVTHQVSEFATAVSRALHVLDAQVTDIRRKVDALAVPPAAVVDVAWAHNPAAWWVETVTSTLASGGGRALHAACGDGWLVGALAGRGVDAYGVDPRTARCPTRSSTRWTCASRTSAPTSVRWRRGRSAASCCRGSSRARVSSNAGTSSRVRRGRLAPGGVLFVHSLSPASWDGRRRAGRGRHGPGPALPGPDMAAGPR